MTKQDLADIVYYRHGGLLKREAGKLVNLMFVFIADRLRRGEMVKISNFGVFSVRRKSKREVLNPRTGKRQLVPSHYSVVFKPSRRLVRWLNSGSN
jgi:integration host factor subunit alpha